MQIHINISRPLSTSEILFNYSLVIARLDFWLVQSSANQLISSDSQRPWESKQTCENRSAFQTTETNSSHLISFHFLSFLLLSSHLVPSFLFFSSLQPRSHKNSLSCTLESCLISTSIGISVNTNATAEYIFYPQTESTCQSLIIHKSSGSSGFLLE